MGQRQAAAAVGGIRTDMRGHDSMLFSVWCAWSQFPGHSTGAHTHRQGSTDIVMDHILAWSGLRLTVSLLFAGVLTDTSHKCAAACALQVTTLQVQYSTTNLVCCYWLVGKSNSSQTCLVAIYQFEVHNNGFKHIL